MDYPHTDTPPETEEFTGDKAMGGLRKQMRAIKKLSSKARTLQRKQARLIKRFERETAELEEWRLIGG